MTLIRIKKGFDLKIQGKPAPEILILGNPDRVAVLPEKMRFVKPKLMVKTGDTVKIGSLLYVDKRNPDIKFLSPGGGTVENINFGPRRIIKEIIIKLDASEKKEVFDSISGDDISGIAREALFSLYASSAAFLVASIEDATFSTASTPASLALATTASRSFENSGKSRCAWVSMYMKANAPSAPSIAGGHLWVTGPLPLKS